MLVSACLVPSAASAEPAAFICISIEDDGPGWPKIDSSSKAEHQLAADDGIAHHGLGLAIVRRVAEKHQGSLTLKESTAGGARAEIWFARNL